MLINAFPQAVMLDDFGWITEEITKSGKWTPPEGVIEVSVQVFGGGGGGGKGGLGYGAGGGGGYGTSKGGAGAPGICIIKYKKTVR